MQGIFKLLNDATTSSTSGPKERQAAAELEPIMERVQALTSDSLADRILDLEGEILEEETDEHFARGFRLGAQIILAVLTPSSFDTI